MIVISGKRLLNHAKTCSISLLLCIMSKNRNYILHLFGQCETMSEIPMTSPVSQSVVLLLCWTRPVPSLASDHLLELWSQPESHSPSPPGTPPPVFVTTAAAVLLAIRYTSAASDGSRAKHWSKVFLFQPESLGHHRCPWAGSLIAVMTSTSTLLNDPLWFSILLQDAFFWRWKLKIS